MDKDEKNGSSLQNYTRIHLIRLQAVCPRANQQTAGKSWVFQTDSVYTKPSDWMELPLTNHKPMIIRSIFFQTCRLVSKRTTQLFSVTIF